MALVTWLRPLLPFGYPVAKLLPPTLVDPAGIFSRLPVGTPCRFTFVTS